MPNVVQKREAKPFTAFVFVRCFLFLDNFFLIYTEANGGMDSRNFVKKTTNYGI